MNLRSRLLHKFGQRTFQKALVVAVFISIELRPDALRHPKSAEA